MRLLKEKMKKFRVKVYLVNTGWVGQSAQSGAKRFSLPKTRNILNAILNGSIEESNFIKDFLAIEENISLVKDLITLGVNPKAVEIKGDNPFSSKSIVITGSFNGIARSQLKEELIRVGAKVSSSVSSKTEFLIAGEKPGSKLKKASDLNIPILDEEETLKILDS